MYDVVRFAGDEKTMTVLNARIKNLRDCRHIRKFSGDVVVKHGTKDIVKDPTWLWDWELNNPKCYARKKIGADVETDPYHKGGD